METVPSIIEVETVGDNLMMGDGLPNSTEHHGEIPCVEDPKTSSSPLAQQDASPRSNRDDFSFFLVFNKEYFKGHIYQEFGLVHLLHST